MKHVITSLLILLLCGCSTPVAKIVQTPSGKAEITIVSDLPTVKSAIIDQTINHGFSLEKDSEYQLEFSRAAQGMENLTIALAAGNSYSTNKRVARFTFSKTTGGVRVILSSVGRAIMPTGKVNDISMDDNAQVFNDCYAVLQELKQRIETQAIAATPEGK